jgi:hypothetical protein
LIRTSLRTVKYNVAIPYCKEKVLEFGTGKNREKTGNCRWIQSVRQFLN